jgi:hypothetical protein
MCLSDDAQKQATIRKGDVLLSPGKQKQHPIKIYDSPLMRNILHTSLGLALGCVVSVFSMYFPYVMTPTESTAVYVKASYNYDPALSFFDNTAWTYATDYALMVVMLSIFASIVASKSGTAAVRLQRRACGLLLCYAASVMAGGVAHHNFLTLESRNTLTFRLLWTMCVGTVTLAGGFMGACGSQVAKLSGSNKYFIPEWFWAGFGCFTTAVCCAGYMSFQRPACDIFIAGITQFPPTVYICLLSVLQMKKQVSTTARYMCVVGFMLNAPLLPLYAAALYHTDWSLARINTMLHCNLCMAWSTQGLVLRHFSEVANATDKKNATKVA